MKTKFRINCTDCLKREYCTDLCDRAKEFAKQDYVSLKEKVLSRPAAYGTWGELSRYVVERGVVLNQKQLCVMVLLSAGVPKEIVMKAMRINGMNMNRMIQVIQNKYRTADIEEKNS